MPNVVVILSKAIDENYLLTVNKVNDSHLWPCSVYSG